MIDSIYQDQTDQVLQDRIDRPLPPPASPGRGFWSTVGRTAAAPVVGVAAGATESAGFGADQLGAFGQITAGYATQADPARLFDPMTKPEQEQSAEAREAVQSGEAFSTPLGTSLRAAAKDMTPDAQTSNAVERLLFGFTKLGVKAVGYSALGGPVPGAVMTAADEATAEAERLKAEGVDPTTRMKAGLVQGIGAGLGVVAPLAGKTAVQTAALVLASGPGAYIAQQAATRAILRDANYKDIAEQYDPFDPVALAVSTLVPAGFGALHMRSAAKAPATPAAGDMAAARSLVDMGANERKALRYDDTRLDAYAVAAAQREGIPPEVLLAIKNAGERSSSSAATSPVGAKGIMQFMDTTWSQYGKGGDVRDPVANIDAAARYTKDLLAQYDGNVRAAIAHYNGGVKAGRAIMEGRLPPQAETARYVRATDDYMAAHAGDAAGRAAAGDPDAVAAARVQQVRDTVESWNLGKPDDVTAATDHLNAFLKASDQLGAGNRVDVTDILSPDTMSHARVLDTMIDRMEASRADMLGEAGNAAQAGEIRQVRQQLEALQSRPVATDDAALRALAKEIQQQGDGRVSYKQALAQATEQTQAAFADQAAQIQRLQGIIERNQGVEQARQHVAALDEQITGARAARAALDAPATGLRPTAQASRTAVRETVRPAEAARAAAEPARAGETEPAKAGSEAPKPATETAQGATAPAEGAPQAMAAADAQVAEIARLSPDLMVELDGMEPMRVGDLLARVKQEAAQEKADASLLEVAAECFLRSA
ncbi:lytic transglycosylase domain-containing protein [Ralstonia syzygii]|uniref:lytic transglycosylase domain-containing protein n=1 Tax=Ralstonia syzygii TaxID=28097 RepID=UPI0035174B6A